MKLSHEVTSWVFWMFKNWRHGYCEYSWSDLMGILNIYEVTSLVFWMTKWCYGNIQKLTSWVFWNSYSKLHDSLNIQNTHDITSRIFKIPMSLWIFKISMSHIKQYTTSFEYSKYPWHHFKNIPKYPWHQLLNIPMTSLCEYSNTNDVTREYSKCIIWIFESCRYGYFENSWSDVIGLLNTHEVTSWLFMNWVFMR